MSSHIEAARKQDEFWAQTLNEKYMTNLNKHVDHQYIKMTTINN